MKDRIIKFFKEEKGAIDDIQSIAIRVGILLMLIVFVFIAMANNTKESGKATNASQRKVNLVLDNEDYTFGVNVKNYASQNGITVIAYDLDKKLIGDITTIADTEMFEETSRSENPGTGKLVSLTYQQIKVSD